MLYLPCTSHWQNYRLLLTAKVNKTLSYRLRDVLFIFSWTFPRLCCTDRNLPRFLPRFFCRRCFADCWERLWFYLWHFCHRLFLLDNTFIFKLICTHKHTHKLHHTKHAFLHTVQMLHVQHAAKWRCILIVHAVMCWSCHPVTCNMLLRF